MDNIENARIATVLKESNIGREVEGEKTKKKKKKHRESEHNRN